MGMSEGKIELKAKVYDLQLEQEKLQAMINELQTKKVELIKEINEV